MTAAVFVRLENSRESWSQRARRPTLADEMRASAAARRIALENERGRHTSPVSRRLRRCDDARRLRRSAATRAALGDEARARARARARLLRRSQTRERARACKLAICVHAAPQTHLEVGKS